MNTTKLIELADTAVTVSEVRRVELPCYLGIEYTVNALRPLIESDFSELRKKGAFLQGQECGEVVSYREADGYYTYTCISVLDSGG
jgi:hypothetical protein